MASKSDLVSTPYCTADKYLRSALIENNVQNEQYADKHKILDSLEESTSKIV